jgi:hypothetical protein
MDELDRAMREAKAAALPFESWERLAGESSAAYAAFCVFRDYGPERNMRKAVEAFEPDAAKRGKRYRVWSGWAAAFKWRDRAADYDVYLDRLQQAERRKTIEAQGERHRVVTGKMLMVVEKKLDLMDPADLSQGAVTEWALAAIKAEREAAGVVAPDGGGGGTKQGEINFAPEFEGL